MAGAGHPSGEGAACCGERDKLVHAISWLFAQQYIRGWGVLNKLKLELFRNTNIQTHLKVETSRNHVDIKGISCITKQTGLWGKANKTYINIVKVTFQLVDSGAATSYIIFLF